MLHLAPTKRFAVISRSDATVPRLPLEDAATTKALQLLKRHGYFVATEIGAALENDVASIEAELENFFAKSTERKEKCMGTVYANERGLPMFRRGYERQENIRECFRVPVKEAGQPWPSPQAKVCWRRVITRFQAVADALLEAVVPGHERGEDFSLAYCFRYGEDDGGANGGSSKTLVGEHADVSLVVVEPVSRVAGLEVYDLCLKRWVCVEAVCVPGRELVVFVGRALSAKTGLPALKHRVVKSHRARTSFLFEQKYGAFFEGGLQH
jgi:hypothetical protein